MIANNYLDICMIMRCRNVSKIVSLMRGGIHPQLYLPREVRAEEATHVSSWSPSFSLNFYMVLSISLMPVAVGSDPSKSASWPATGVQFMYDFRKAETLLRTNHTATLQNHGVRN